MIGYFLSFSALNVNSSGGELVANRNFKYFNNYNSNLLKIEVFDSKDILNTNVSFPKKYYNYLVNIFSSNALTFNINFLSLLYKKIEVENIEFIFFDSTLFGSIAKKIKQKFPNIKIIIFSHNVELISSWHSFKYDFSIKKVYLLIFAYINEKRSCSYSDYLIGISSYDTKLYSRFFKSKFNCIIPVTLSDKYKTPILFEEPIKNAQIKILFIGSNFYPNVHGIEWFIENVFNNIFAELTIVGSGMAALADKYTNLKKNLHFYDYVDDLSFYYNDTNIVISPIFIGSGMKVKVAEALMYGKTILGTSLSFQGYDVSNADCYLCNSKEDYIYRINTIKQSLDSTSKYSKKSRQTFLDHYCDSNDDKYFSSVINFIKKNNNE